MSNASRKQRGSATQQLVAASLRGLFPYATDAGAGRPGQDVLNTPGISVEVKARSDFSPVATLRQAKSNAKNDDIPVAVVRMNGQGPANIDDWIAFVSFGDLKRLLKWMVDDVGR